MCFNCNPFCGNCKPPLTLCVLCPDCGTANMMTREQYLMYRGLKHRMTPEEREMHAAWDGNHPACEKCGNDIFDAMAERVRTKPCYRSHIICGYPCGKSNTPLKEGEEPCQKMVPLEKFTDELPDSLKN